MIGILGDMLGKNYCLYVDFSKIWIESDMLFLEVGSGISTNIYDMEWCPSPPRITYDGGEMMWNMGTYKHNKLDTQ